MMNITIALRRLAIAGIALMMGIGAAQAGTIVVGLNANGSNPDSSKIQQYNTDGTFIGTLAGPPDVVDPIGFATDNANNLYIGGQDSQQIVRITPGGTTSVFKTGLSAMLHMASGPGDNSIYFTQTGGVTSGNLNRLNSDGSVDLLLSGAANDVAVSAGGTVYYSAGTKLFSFVSGISTEITDFGSGNGIVSLEMDNSGNVLALLFSGSVQSVTGGGTVTSLAAFGGSDVTVDDAGNIYIADGTAGTVRKLASDGTDLGIIVSGLTQPFRIGYWDPEADVVVVAADAPWTLVSFAAGLGLLAAARRRRASADSPRLLTSR